MTWELHGRAPDARLRGDVRSYTGYVEHAAGPMRRLEAPIAAIVMIISLGPSLLVDSVRHRSFVAGLDDGVTVTEFSGEQRGIQADLTPLGARRLLGVPMGELAPRRLARRRLRRRGRSAACRAPARSAELGGALRTAG